MRRLAVTGFVFTALVFAFVPRAQAQTCAGTPAITKARSTQGGVGVAFGEDIFAVAAAFTGGTDSLLAGVTLARGTIESAGEDLSSTVLGLNAGLQVAVTSDKRSMFCPTVAFSKSFGPNDILGTGIDASERSIGGGGSFGVIVGDKGSVQFVPTAGLQVLRTRQTLKLGGNSASESDTHGILTLGLGVLLNDRISVLPNVRIPFSIEDGTNLYGIVAFYSFGK